MNHKPDDQSKYADRAMTQKREKESDSSPHHPQPGRTANEGFQPIERENPIDLDEKTAD